MIDMARRLNGAKQKRLIPTGMPTERISWFDSPSPPRLSDGPKSMIRDKKSRSSPCH